MRRAIGLAWEFVCITGLVAVGVMVAPYVLWRWLNEPRTWREPKDVGHGGYEHP